MGYIGNAPYQGVLTGGNIQDGTVETTDLADGAVTTVKMGDGQVTVGKLASTLDLSAKTVTLPAGVGGHASGTEANRPASPAVGTIYFNTTQDTLQQYKSTGWEDVGTTPPAISSVSGNIINTIATNLTISGASFGVGATVRFAYGGTTTDVSVATASDTSIQVTVPSAVYNQAASTVVTISVISSGRSSNGSSKTVVGLPTGGTITTVGNYRIHAFNSSGTFTNTIAGLTADYFIVAGGGGGGGSEGGQDDTGGGGGGGGGGANQYLSQTLSAQSFSVVVGAGGSGGDISGSNGSSGGNSSFNGITMNGGGYGGGSGASSGNAGGSGGSGGGGGGHGTTTNSGGSGTSGQGNAGASSSSSAGGGGGGKGSAGSGMDGGSAVTYTLAGSGDEYYSGGGSSEPGGGGAPGTPGLNAGKGGERGVSEAGDGVANRGGGGGGGCDDFNTAIQEGGNGGSGRVVIRYDLTAI